MTQLPIHLNPASSNPSRPLTLQTAAAVCFIQPEGVIHPRGMAWAYLPSHRAPEDLRARSSRWTAPLVSFARKHQVIYVLCGDPPAHLLQWLTPELSPYLHPEFASLNSPDFWGEFRWQFANALYAADTYARLHAVQRWLYVCSEDLNQASRSTWRGRYVRCDSARGLLDPCAVAALEDVLAKGYTPPYQVRH